jgi:hypothetical protein
MLYLSSTRPTVGMSGEAYRLDTEPSDGDATCAPPVRRAYQTLVRSMVPRARGKEFTHRTNPAVPCPRPATHWADLRVPTAHDPHRSLTRTLVQGRPRVAVSVRPRQQAARQAGREHPRTPTGRLGKCAGPHVQFAWHAHIAEMPLCRQLINHRLPIRPTASLDIVRTERVRNLGRYWTTCVIDYSIVIGNAASLLASVADGKE